METPAAAAAIPRRPQAAQSPLLLVNVCSRTATFHGNPGRRSGHPATPAGGAIPSAARPDLSRICAQGANRIVFFADKAMTTGEHQEKRTDALIYQGGPNQLLRGSQIGTRALLGEYLDPKATADSDFGWTAYQAAWVGQ